MLNLTGHPRLSELAKAAFKILEPPRDLKLSEWAEEYAYLSAENSAEPGKWHNIPYQIDIMDAITDPNIERVTVKKSARVGYTKIVDHAIGYFIHHDPSPILVVQPTIEDAEGYSKDEIAPMIRDTPVLADIFGDMDAKNSGQTISVKSYPGGKLYLIGANSPRGFRRITVRVVIFDEIDGYPVTGAGKDGDQIKLGIKRAETFFNRKIIEGSTPLEEESSRIHKSFMAGDQRHCYLPCPHCHEKQILVFENLRWPEGKPEEAKFACIHCGVLIEERFKLWMLQNREWIAHAPFNPITRHASFHIWTAYSTFPNASWGKLAKEWEDVKSDPLQRKVFTNTVLGEVWTEPGETVEPNALMERRYPFPAEMPAQALILTAGVDVQRDRLEVEVVGWGIGEQSWSIAYRTFWGDPNYPDVWEAFDDFRHRSWLHQNGHRLLIQAICIDSGGSNTQAVYNYCAGKLGNRVYAVKGKGGALPVIKAPQEAKPGARHKRPCKVFTIGVDQVKTLIYSRLVIKEVGPGYCHFNSEVDETGRIYNDEEFFRQLTAEKLITVYKKGFAVREWHNVRDTKRNEALDCRVYAYAALKMVEPAWYRLERRLAPVKTVDVESEPMENEQIETLEQSEAENERQAEPEKPVENKKKKKPSASRPRSRRRGNFVNSW